MFMSTSPKAQVLRLACSLAMVGAAAIGLVPSFAGAALLYTGQARSVTVSGVAFDPVHAAASGFALFNRTVGFTDPFEGHGGTAMQRSELLADRVSIASQLTARDGRAGFSAAAESHLDVTFMLSTPASTAIGGGWSMNTPATGVTLDGVARLSREGTVLWSVPIATSFPTTQVVPLGFAADLESGIYRLEVRAVLEANILPGTTSGTAALNLELLVPAPGLASPIVMGAWLVAGRRQVHAVHRKPASRRLRRAYVLPFRHLASEGPPCDPRHPPKVVASSENCHPVPHDRAVLLAAGASGRLD